MSDEFGFGAAKPKALTADKLKNIKPQPSHEQDREVPLDRLDRVAEKAGFTSREPQQVAAPRIDRRRKDAGPFVAINTRAPVRVAEPFQRYCDNNRFSYWEGIEELMKLAGVMR
jgi:hypothetical protein